MFHKHEWELIGKTCSPPLKCSIECTGTDNLMEKALFGFYEFLLKCSKCGRITKKELIGQPAND